MKLILFSHEYPPCLGGAGTIANSLYSYFKTSNSYNIQVITSKRSHSIQSNDIITSKYPPLLWPITYYLEQIDRLRDADVIICNDPAAIYSAGRYFSDAMLKRTICVIHGREKYLEPESKARFIGFSKFFNKALTESAHIIFVSEYIKRLYIECHNIDISNVSHTVINPGIIFSKHVEQEISDKVANQFITAARVVREKGFDYMFDVFCELKRRNLDFKWLIAGDGNYLEDLKLKIKNSEIAGNVNFTGALPKDKLVHEYIDSSYCILLSELDESFGLSYLEAANFGCKSIGYDKAGVTEAFNHLDNGLLLSDFKNLTSNCNQVMNFIEKNANQIGNCNRFDTNFVTDVEKIVRAI